MTLLDQQDAEPVDVAALFLSHGRAAHRIAFKVLGDSDLAAEAVQDAFLSMWRCRYSYRSERSDINVWVWTLVHRRAVDLLRRKATRPLTRPLDGTGAPDIATAQPGPEGLACDSDQRLRVRAAIDLLRLPYREVLRLVLEGHTQAEIALSLGIPLGTVKSRTLYGKRAVRRLVPRETLR